MRTKLSLALILPLLLMMAVGVMATETVNPNPFAEEVLNGCVLTDYEHSPPEAVYCAMITFTVEDAVCNPFNYLINSATANAPTTENTVFVITLTISNVTGATDRASPAMAINENEYATVLFQFDVYAADGRVSPIDFAMWNDAGLINYANYVESKGMQYTAEYSEVAFIAKDIVGQYSVASGIYFLNSSTIPASERAGPTNPVMVQTAQVFDPSPINLKIILIELGWMMEDAEYPTIEKWVSNIGFSEKATQCAKDIFGIYNVSGARTPRPTFAGIIVWAVPGEQMYPNPFA